MVRVGLGLVLPWRCPGRRRMVAYPRWAYRVDHITLHEREGPLLLVPLSYVSLLT